MPSNIPLPAGTSVIASPPPKIDPRAAAQLLTSMNPGYVPPPSRAQTMAEDLIAVGERALAMNPVRFAVPGGVPVLAATPDIVHEAAPMAMPSPAVPPGLTPPEAGGAEVPSPLRMGLRSIAGRPAELRAYHPTWRERAAGFLMGPGKPSPEERRFATNFMGTHDTPGIIDVVPMVSQLLAMQEAYRAGDAQGFALAALPIPGARLAKPTAKGAEKTVDAVSSALVPGAAPDRTRYSLVRYAPPRGTSARVQRLDRRLRERPEVLAGLRRLTVQGEEVGRSWYNTEKLRDRFVDVLGPEQGDAAWREYMWLVGATSPGSNVPANIKNASHYFVQGRQKLARIADDLMGGRYKPPKGYGHREGKTQAKNVGFWATGRWGPGADPRLSPKPRGFAQGLVGSNRNIAGDRHFMRIMGMTSGDPEFLHRSAHISRDLASRLRARYGARLDPYLKIHTHKGRAVLTFNAKGAVKDKDAPNGLFDFIKGEPSVWEGMPSANEYAALERLIGNLAREANMTPAQFQASLWMGAAKQTGVDPRSLDTFVNLFDKRVRDTARERDLSPDEVFRRFATRKEALTLPLGLVGGGAVLHGFGEKGGQ